MTGAILILWLMFSEDSRVVEIKYNSMADCLAAREMMDVQKVYKLSSKRVDFYKETYGICVPAE